MKRPVIYLLEPDKVLAASYESLLSELGEVRVFHTAEKAIKAFEQVVPDVVVLELALPAHGGFEFLYEMISYSDTKGVKVVINSCVQPEALPWGVVNGGDLHIVHHLYKASSGLDDLLRAVKETVTA